MRIAFSVLRNDFRSRISALLVAVGVAIGVSLVLWLVAAPDALQARADRAAWRDVPNSSGSLVVAVNRDEYSGRMIERFDVSGRRDTPVAAGIPHLPGPGEVLLSPALQELVNRTPPEKLGDRFPGKVVGQLGPQTLQFPEELVAIVGHAPGDVVGKQLPGLVGSSGQVGDRGTLYLLTRVGLVVLVVPCLVLVASAARLTAARRARRLEALRLAGATPRQVVAITATEMAVGVAAGTAVGVAVAYPLSHLTARVPWAGGTWYPGDFTAHPALTALVAVLAPLLTVAAAVVGLARGPELSDLSGRIRSRGTPKRGDARVSVGRLLWLAGSAVVFLVGVVVAREVDGIDQYTTVIAGVGAVSLALVLAGPVLTAFVGKLFVREWRSPATLFAGRRLEGDPVAAFRGCAGIVVAVFAGSMALTMLPTLEDRIPYSDDTWSADAIVARKIADPRQIDALKAATSSRVVPITEDGTGAIVARCADLALVLNGLECGGEPAIHVPQGMDVNATFQGHTLTGPVRTYPGQGHVVIDPELLPALKPTGVAVLAEANREVVHTAVVRTLPGAQLHTWWQITAWGDTLTEDLRRATVIGLAIAALIGGAAAAVAAAGSVIDRRRTFGALIAAGTPTKTLATALRREVVLPVIAATLGACAAGYGVGFGLLQIARETPVAPTPWVLTPVAVGIVVALVAAAACGPVLRGIRPGDYATE